jgi:uncharacterized membrane protein YeaQ/YmgE (transglycosylase-associated protein family)
VAGCRAHSGFHGSKVVNRSGEGLARDIILGVIGAVVGDAIFTELGLVGVTGVYLTNIVVAAVGAILVLVVYHLLTRQRARA